MKLTHWQKLLYAAGSLGVALSYQAFGTYIQFLYIDILGLKASLVGVGWGLYGIWNAVNDPLAGYWSDRTNTRLGRRIPWILSTFIPVGLFFYLLWVPPTPLIRGGQTPLFVYFMAVVLVFDLLWTVIVMNWTALFPEMITGERERASVSGWRQFFSIFGLLVGVALPPVLVGADWSGRGGMALAFAVITSLTFGLSLLGSKESPGAHRDEPAMPFVQAVKASFQRPAFRWFLVANLHKEFIFSILTASIPFWAKYVLRIQGPATLLGAELDAGLQNSLLLGGAFVMALPALPVWTAVAKRLGGRRGWQMAQFTFALSMVAIFLAQDFFQGLAATSLTGLSLAGLLVFPDLVISDVIDEDETVTGARREGMYFGINGFIIRFAFTMQGVTTGVILNTSGYVNSTAADLYPDQPGAALMGIRVMTALIPVLASAVVVFALDRYPLHGERHKALQSKLAFLRQGGG